MDLISKDAEIGKNVKLKPGVIIEEGAIIGDNCRIGYNAVIKKNVHLGADSIIGDFVILGEYVSFFYKHKNKQHLVGYYEDHDSYENPTLKIGENALIGSYTLIYADCEIGSKFETGSWVKIRQGCKIGHNNYIGNHSEFWGPLKVGDHNRFISCAHIGDTTIIGNFCWFLPYAETATDLHPPCGKCIQGPVIEDFVVIGILALIYPRVTIGKNAVISAFSLVTRDVPPETIVAGNPAKEVGKIKEFSCPFGIMDKGPYPWYDNMTKDRRKKYGFPS